MNDNHTQSIAQALISIIILNWNRKSDIEDTLRGLRDQTYSNYEVIIIDNGSTDGSQQMIAQKFPEYRLINLPRNLGCEEGFNVGIVNANGSIIVFLDNDALLESDALERMINEFENDPSLGIIDPLILNYYSREITNAPQYWPLKMFTGCAAAVRKEIFDKTGLRPEKYFIYASEPDVCIRALDAGYGIKHCPDIVAFHKESPEKRLSSKFYFYSTRNILWLIWKYYPFLPAINETLFHLMVNMIRSLRQMAFHYYLAGVLDAIIKAPVILYKKRKPLKNWKAGRVYPSYHQLADILRKKNYFKFNK